MIEGLENVYGFKTVNRIRNAAGEATVINKATVVRGSAYEHKLETIDDASGLLYENPDSLVPRGAGAQPSSGSGSRGSDSRPKPRVSTPVLQPRGSSARPSGGSSTRP